MGLPPLLFFTVLAFMVIRSGRVSWLDVVIFVCFGYYLGGSTFGRMLNAVVVDINTLIGGMK